jgi:hypothetical protein
MLSSVSAWRSQCLLQQRVPQEARLMAFRQRQLEFDFFSHGR